MTLDDLKYIFKPQLDSCESVNTKLFFALIDGDRVMINRHPADDLTGLLPLLDNFAYNGSEGNIPRFAK